MSAELAGQPLIFDDAVILDRIRLNITDAARLCGITSRQLNYWTSKGLVPAESDRPRRYTLAGLAVAYRIKRLLDEGYSLDRAVRMLRQERATTDTAHTNAELRASVEARLAELAGWLLRIRAGVPSDLLYRRLSTQVARLAEPTVRSRLAGADSAAIAARGRLEAALEAVSEALRLIDPPDAP